MISLHFSWASRKFPRSPYYTLLTINILLSSCDTYFLHILFFYLYFLLTYCDIYFFHILFFFFFLLQLYCNADFFYILFFYLFLVQVNRCIYLLLVYLIYL